MDESVRASDLAGLRGLLDREAIRDVLARSSRGLDRVAPEILRAIYHDDSIDHHGGFEGTGQEFADLPSRQSPDNLVAHHALAQSIIDLDGEVAHAETYFLMHYERFARRRDEVRAGAMIGRYLDRLDKRAGEWRITVRRVLIDTSRESGKGDQPPGVTTFPAGARWPDDEVFHLDRLRLP